MKILFTVAVAPDSNTLISGHQDGTSRVWDFLRSPTCVHSIKQHIAHVTHVQYSPKNSYEILTTSKDNTLSVLDTRNYNTVQVL